jgi:hypothetical protein
MSFSPLAGLSDYTHESTAKKTFDRKGAKNAKEFQ